MFTGIIQYLGRLAAFERAWFGATLGVDASGWNHSPHLGDSIAVNGCCLTVAASPTSGLLRFDVIRQTLDVTTLGCLAAGESINLEHAVTPQTMLGGHIVQGHVDGVGIVNEVVRGEAEHRLRVTPPPPLMECIIEKGSVAVNGVSLTVASVGDQWFEFALIPTTLRLTNLGELREGSRVNLETDYIAKTVVNWLRRSRVKTD